MSGGELETRLLVDVQNKDPDKLCVAVLKDNGIVNICLIVPYHLDIVSYCPRTYFIKGCSRT